MQKPSSTGYRYPTGLIGPTRFVMVLASLETFYSLPYPSILLTRFSFPPIYLSSPQSFGFHCITRNSLAYSHIWAYSSCHTDSPASHLRYGVSQSETFATAKVQTSLLISGQQCVTSVGCSRPRSESSSVPGICPRHGCILMIGTRALFPKAIDSPTMCCGSIDWTSPIPTRQYS